jgi:superfamily I DNA and/or RNA helicase
VLAKDSAQGTGIGIWYDCHGKATQKHYVEEQGQIVLAKIIQHFKIHHESIGTVHTFQGKEAEIVYFVVGTDQQSDSAADWTGKKTNLLNMAVSRDKTRILFNW